MKIVSVKIPRSYLEEIDLLVKKGFYTSRSEFIRTALRILLIRELERLSNEDNMSSQEIYGSGEETSSFKRSGVKKTHVSI